MLHYRPSLSLLSRAIRCMHCDRLIYHQLEYCFCAWVVCFVRFSMCVRSVVRRLPLGDRFKNNIKQIRKYVYLSLSLSPPTSDIDTSIRMAAPTSSPFDARRTQNTLKVDGFESNRLNGAAQMSIANDTHDTPAKFAIVTLSKVHGEMESAFRWR